MDILSKILKYESTVFNEYLVKRQSMLRHLENVDVSLIDKNQLNVLVHDLKSIIEPVKTSISEIDYYFTNTDFKKTKSLKHLNQLKSLMSLYILLNQSDTEDTEDTETPDSEPVSVSESDSESDSSSSEV